MASSGTITGNQVSTRPYLSIYWRILEQDIPGNRSKVRLELRLHSPYSLYFSASKSGKLEGQSFTYTGGFSGTGTKTVRTRDVWVGHNSDGSKTATFDGSLTLNVYWRQDGVTIGTLSVSGTANLDRIPRETKIRSVSNFTIGQHPAISFDVRYSGFRHDVVAKIGGSDVQRWDNISSLPTSLDFNSTADDRMYSWINNSTTGKMRVYVNTRSTSGKLIGQDYVDVTVSVPSSVRPSITNFSTSVLGNGHDKTIGKYVQNISRLYAHFDTAAGRGARITSTNIVVRRQSDKGNEMRINGTDGNSGTLTLSGTYEVIATSVDSRGRTTQSTIDITVHAYSPPSITHFSANRDVILQTRVAVRREGTFSPLGGDNTLTITIERNGGSGWTSVDTSTVTGSPFGAYVYSEGNNVQSSYEFRVVVRDLFGKEQTATGRVPTARVLFDWHKNEGIGIGKIHERGVLDVDGEAYIRGLLTAQASETGGFIEMATDSGYGNAGIRLGDRNNAGTTPFIDFHAVGDATRSARILTGGGETGKDYTGWMEILADDLNLNVNSLKINGTSTGRDLWYGNSNLDEGVVVRPNSNIQNCPNGWVLVFDTGSESRFKTFFVHKWVVNRWEGASHELPMVNLNEPYSSDSAQDVFSKLVYLYNDRIEGFTGNKSGVRNRHRLRRVLAW